MVLVQKELYAAYIGEWYVVPTSISLDKSSISLNTVWQTEQLTATVLPADARQTVTWTSSNTSIATVDTTWLVTCVTPWECTITATTVNWLTATCGVEKATIYSINLANSSTSALIAAWWAYRWSTPSFNSTWAYLPSNSKTWIYKAINISWASRIVITSNWHFVSIADMSLWIQLSSQSNYYYWYKGKLTAYSLGIIYNDSFQSSTSMTVNTWNYKNVIDINLSTGATTYTLSWDASWTTSYTMNSSQLSNVKTRTYVWAWFEAYSSSAWTNWDIIKDIKIEVYN